MKLTKAQFRALNQMADTSRIYFTSSEGREAVKAALKAAMEAGR